MSHKQLRNENDCLNCGREVMDRYCTHCGQENLQIQDSAPHLVMHYVQDLFHYDGKLWHTLKSLITHPGKVAAEYMEGKRMQNLEPIRFYVFSSTVFFLLLFSVVNGSKNQKDTNPADDYARRLYNLKQEKKFIGSSDDTLHVNILLTHLLAKMDSIEKVDSTSQGLTLDFTTPLGIDTADRGWFQMLLFKRAEARRAEMEKKYGPDTRTAASDFLNELLHKFPILLFVSMPFFALMLKLLYFRPGRKRYVHHFIFSIYHYAYLFVMSSFLLISQFIFRKILKDAAEPVNSTLMAVFIIYFIIYLWLSMRRFYGDRWFFRLPRYIVLISAILTIMLILFFIFFFFTLLG